MRAEVLCLWLFFRVPLQKPIRTMHVKTRWQEDKIWCIVCCDCSISKMYLKFLGRAENIQNSVQKIVGHCKYRQEMRNKGDLDGPKRLLNGEAVA
ncbi:hypothetical protein GYMLUDRAFT_543436 [Collybiopsis luxurians FD-317 M1]|nr:hypothetical protein GYMLUDRAFT_543436 [Collybiopsis luxurians FD-317 M1]